VAISSEVIRNDYVGNGVLDTFAFEYIIYDQDDIDVYVDGVIQSVDVNFTIASEHIGDATGGNIVFGVGHIPADEAEVALLSGLSYTQQTVLASRDKTYEDTYDKAVVLIKQLKEMISRCLALDIYSTSNNLTLPEPEAGYHLKWKDDLSGFENVFVPTFPNPVALYYLRWLADLSGLENVVPAPEAGSEVEGANILLDVDVTIVGGKITCLEGPANYVVDTEGGAATDTLTEILGLSTGECFQLSAKSATRVVTIEHGANLRLMRSRNFSLNSLDDSMSFRAASGVVMRELSRISSP